VIDVAGQAERRELRAELQGDDLAAIAGNADVQLVADFRGQHLTTRGRPDLEQQLDRVHRVEVPAAVRVGLVAMAIDSAAIDLGLGRGVVGLEFDHLGHNTKARETGHPGAVGLGQIDNRLSVGQIVHKRLVDEDRHAGLDERS